jgi:hypothetical protein
MKYINQTTFYFAEEGQDRRSEDITDHTVYISQEVSKGSSNSC